MTASMKLVSNQDSQYNIQMNIQTIIESSRVWYPDNLVMEHLSQAQAILESAVLRSTGPSQLSLRYNNLFGITDSNGTHTPSRVNLPSHEEVNGVLVPRDRWFSWNNSLEDSFKQHRDLMSHPRYHNLWLCQTFPEVAQLVRKDGYATDSSYSDSLIQVWENHLKDVK